MKSCRVSTVVSCRGWIRAGVVASLVTSAVAWAQPVAAQTIAGGASHTIILKPDGTVWSSGNNDNGQLGSNSQTNSKTPIQVSGLSDVIAVAAGAYHSLALTSGGTVYAWGDNQFGQIGDGSTTDRWTPVVVSLSNVTAIAAGEYHSLALQASGDIYSWGRNGNGQLAIGNTTNASSPTFAIAGGAAIGAGFTHSLAVKTDGTAWAAGLNGNGQLGDSSQTQRTSFVQMSGISGASKVAGGRMHTLVMLTNGTVKATGANGWGQIGNNSFTQQTSAVTVSTITNVTAIAAHDDRSLALTSGGVLWGWGINGDGQVGDGTTTARNAPVAISTLSSVEKIGAGQFHTMAVTSTGVVFTWGRNNAGQLGNGTTISRTSPGAISGPNYDWKVATPVFGVAAGTYYANQTVVVTVDTAGATIHYTQNGNEPTEADPTVASGASVVIDASQTLKAKAFKSLVPDSDTAAAAYTMKVASLYVVPTPGTYTTAQNVTLSTTTPGATIRYTADGSTPTESSTLYTGPFTVATTTAIKAVGFKAGWSESLVQGGTYTMNFGTLAAPTMTPATGTYESSTTVEMSSSQSGATIRYTTNGSTPTSSSTLYSGPLLVESTMTVKAKAFHADYATSAETNRTYTITVAAPTFTPTAGTYAAGQTVTISSATLGATIRYTLTGVDPVDTDATIASGGSIMVGNYTLKAKASKTGATTSAVCSATYELAENLVTATIATGDSHTLAIRADGVAWAWGKNNVSQLGDGTAVTPRLSPINVGGVTGAKAIDGGTDYSLVLKTDGTVVGFGSNANGRLGDGTTTNRSLATPVTGLSGVSAIAAGDHHAVALKTDGSLVAWGRNDFGQVGDSSTTQRLTPTSVSNLANVTAIAAGWGFTLARTQSGTIAAWGYNANGRLGDGTTTTRTSAVTVSGIIPPSRSRRSRVWIPQQRCAIPPTARSRRRRARRSRPADRSPSTRVLRSR